MTQHEYVFVAVSIILGLAITRILHSVATLIRIHSRVTFHWSTALWATSVTAYVLQLWWVGWGLREVTQWTFLDFLVLIIGSIFIYGAAEMALPVPDDDDDDDELDFLRHSQGFGRLSVLSMLLYFCIVILPVNNGHPVKRVNYATQVNYDKANRKKEDRPKAA